MTKQSLVYLDGRFLKVGAKTLDVFTPGIFQGEGVFETMLAIGQKVFDVQLHLKRLNASFKGVKVTRQIIQQVVNANDFAISRVRILVWKQKKDVHVAVMALKYEPSTKVEYKVCLMKTTRVANSRLANRKSLDYSLFYKAYSKAQENGYDEALLMNNKGNIFEASRSNVFWISEGSLFTPPLSSGCLNGIIRQQTIMKAKVLGISVIEKNLTVKELTQADQVFLTNSLIGITPVNKPSFQRPHRIS